MLTNARAIIENAFTDSFFHQELMIGIREPVCFVTDALKQAQITKVGIATRAESK